MSDPAPPPADHGHDDDKKKAKGAGLSNKIVLAVAAVNLLATTGLGAVVVLRGNSAPAAPAAEHGEAPADGGPAGEHGEAKAGEHGEAKPAEGGHGEAKPAEGGHGEAKPAEGGHGEAKPAEGGHGAPPAEGGHGAPPAAEGGHGAPAPAASSDGGGMKTARLEDIVVHLRNPEVDRYARLTIDVEMENADEVKQLEDNVPRVRDAVITTLSSHTFEELRGAEGLGRLKSWLREAIDNVVPGHVTAVYVSAFLVQ
jgi:flagellar basal body-associated protein FliL